jgi:transposase, IS5 family
VDVPKVAPPQAVDQLQQVLDSPEVARLVKCIEYMRWTGRPGYPVRAMVGMCLVKSIYVLPTWSRTVRLVAEHPGLQAVLGCAPSQWACYRFARQLRERDGWALAQCLNDVISSLGEQHPEMGKDVAIDASDLPAYANGHPLKHDGTERKFSDSEASWGYRSGVSTRGKGLFYGYKIHAAVDVATDLPLAWTIRPANTSEYHIAMPLINRTLARGFKISTAIMDKGYDSHEIHHRCMNQGIAPIIPLKETQNVKRGAGEPPHCVHGEWTFAGADFKRQATKWRCPTGECQPASMWRKANRLHPLIPRESKRHRDLYRKRSSVEREFGRLKHEWSLLPLRVRGIDRVALHADLTILTRLSCALNRVRAQTLPLAA